MFKPREAAENLGTMVPKPDRVQVNDFGLPPLTLQEMTIALTEDCSRDGRAKRALVGQWVGGPPWFSRVVR